jgi:hypothetical protein
MFNASTSMRFALTVKISIVAVCLLHCMQTHCIAEL